MELRTHYWIAEGTGELTSRWVNPICDRNVRRHVDDFKVARPPSPDDKPCDDCVAITTAMGIDLAVRR